MGEEIEEAGGEAEEIANALNGKSVLATMIEAPDLWPSKERIAERAVRIFGRWRGKYALRS